MLDIPEDLRAEMAERCRAAYPEEACGLFLGHVDGTKRSISQLFAVKNTSQMGRDRSFELDPDGFLAGDQQARATLQEIVGIYHSHPDQAAEPSATDLEQAQPGWSYVILSVSSEGVGDLRSFRLKQQKELREFEEEPIAFREAAP